MGAPLRSVSLLTMWRPPQINFFAYQVGAPSDQILRIPYGGGGGGGGPQVSFFTYYRGPLRSVSLHTICGAPSDQILCLVYGGPLRSIYSLTMWGVPQVSFFAYYMGAPPEISLIAYYRRAPLRSVSSLTIWEPPK